MNYNFKDIAGRRFGRLTAQWPAGRKNLTYWLCLCACGKLRINTLQDLTTGNTKSCGCLRRELSAARFLKHGHARARYHTAEYFCWRNMLNRCLYKKGEKYKTYGARGIRVCKRWMRFENFLADMGRRPKGRTLDRRNNDGNYTPKNCHWATPSEQAFNRRRKK